MDYTEKKKMIVWQKLENLNYKLYLITKEFSKTEMNEIKSLLRKAAHSLDTCTLPLKRLGDSLSAYNMHMTMGALAEAEYLLEFTCSLDYPIKDHQKTLKTLKSRIDVILSSIYKTL